MRKTVTPKKNSSPKIKFKMPWRASEVKPLDNYELAVKFPDGTSGIVKMRERIFSKNSGVFSQLADKKIFDQVHIELGVVTWPNELDLAPDTMYMAIKEYGVWELK